MKKLFWAAALGGGFYWASKQPGGVSGVWERFNDKLKRVQDSEQPLQTAKSEFGIARNSAAQQELDTASVYTPIPETSSAA